MPTRVGVSSQVSNYILRFLTISMLIGLTALPSLAQTITWTGSTDTDWNKEANWSGNAVPTANNDVVIADVANKPTIGASTAAVASSIEVQSGAVLTIAGSATLTINGSKSLDGRTTAFYNAGTVENSGQLVIGANTPVGEYGIHNKATFTNNTGGHIQIDRGKLFNADGTFINAGNLIIGTGDLDNYGEATLTNKTGGKIQLDGGTLRNLFHTLINNDGSIIISANADAPVREYGIYTTEGTFNNNMGGQIQIDRCSTAGWYSSYFGTINNAGSIVIGTNASVGLWGLVVSYTAFNNNAGGKIQIDNSSQYGLLNGSDPDNAQFSFTNVGSIVIGAKASVGQYGLYNDAGSFNNTGGQIQIDNSSQTGLFIDWGTVTNAGSVVIGANTPVGEYGIHNKATFTNKGCARMTLFAPFYNSASFTQQGLLTVNSTQTHSNTGFSNDGVMAYPQGNPIPNITNNGIIAAPINTTCGLTASPALQIVSNTLQVATTWYRDSQLNAPAGSYNANTFTATNNLALGGSSPVYFSVSNPETACSWTVSIPVTVNVPPTASISPSFTTLTCANPAATLSASGGDSYQWSTGKTTPTISVTTAGTYSVTVTAANGCSATASASITENKTMPTINLAASSLTVTAGQSVTLTASGGNTYLWSTGANTSITTVTPSIGSTPYSVTVTGANGCTATASVTITVNPGSLNLLAPLRLCIKSTPPTNMVVTLPLTMTVTGGTSPYIYSWSYKAPSSPNYKPIPAKGVDIGKVTMKPSVNSGTLTLTGTRGNLNGLQGYVIQLTVTDSRNLTRTGETLLDGNCSLSVPNVREGVLSVEEVQVQVYPNPVADILQVVIPGLSQPAKIGLFDLQGRQRGQWTAKPVEGMIHLKASVSDLTEGLYLLQVETAEGVLSRQRVLKR